ncbi:MAG: hypothetical protein U0531_00260 [Dehalococcoidia bacterium]
MDQADGVHRVESACQLLDKLYGLGDGQRTAPRENVHQRAALDQFHRQIGAAVRLARVQHLDDVGMADLRQQPPLAHEARPGFGVEREMGVQDLERDISVEQRIIGAVDDGEATGAEGKAQLVASDRSRAARHRSSVHGVSL